MNLVKITDGTYVNTETVLTVYRSRGVVKIGLTDSAYVSVENCSIEDVVAMLEGRPTTTSRDPVQADDETIKRWDIRVWYDDSIRPCEYAYSLEFSATESEAMEAGCTLADYNAKSIIMLVEIE